MRIVATIGAGLFIMVLAGAGEKQPAYEAIVKDIIRLIGDMTTQLKMVKEDDKASADGARPALVKAAKEFVALRDKEKKAKPPSLEKKNELEKLYKEKMEKTVKLFNAEMARVRSFATGKKLTDEIADLLAIKKQKKKP